MGLKEVLTLFNSAGIPAGILSFIQIHGYGIIFLLMFFEGPIVTYITAFAASLGIFNIYLVLLLSILGNSLPDVIYFWIGRTWKNIAIKNYVDRSFDKKGITKIREYLHKNPWKALLVIKLTPPLPLPGLILAGTTELKFIQFLFYSVVISTIYSIFFVVLGFFSGVISNNTLKYLNYSQFLIGGFVIIVIVLWFGLRFLTKRLSGIMKNSLDK